MRLLKGQFEGTIGSDLERDGMFLEVCEPANPKECVLEIFYSDVTNSFSLTLFKEDVDMNLVKEAIEIAEQRLVPEES